jgi:hypothetical protein
MGHKAQEGLYIAYYIKYLIPFSTPSLGYGTELGRECQAR